MSARKIDKLEQRLYRTIREIRESESPSAMLDYIKRFGRLDQQYYKITGTRFNPIRDHESIQDIDWY